VAIGAAGILSFGSTSVQAAMNFGATQKSFEVLTGSKKQGRDLSNNLNTLQQNTILGPEVFKAAQTMLSFGVATEKVVQVTKQLGDVSMGNTDKFNALTLAYSQTQAAGKLMGQDLLQYINAGFNPLQTMAERWKDFGFKQKVSIGQLKEMMEKGKISAEMVAKAFDLATSSGGKFNGMMDAIADTSYGKLQILSGQWENFKIQIGNALMPMAEGLMSVANKTLSWLSITKTVPETLRTEQAEVTSLLGVITKLNQGNDLRKNLLQNLVTKYPDLFKNIDVEKTTNADLLVTLNKINDAYEKRIGLASSDIIIDTQKQAAKEAQTEYQKYATMVELYRRGDEKSVALARSMAPGWRRVGSYVGNMFGSSLGTKQTRMDEANWAQSQMNVAKGNLDSSQQALMKEGQIRLNKSITATFQDAMSFMKDSQAMSEAFGTNKDLKNEFHRIVKDTAAKVKAGTATEDDMTRLKNSMSPSSIKSGKKDTVTAPDAPGSAARSITSGGPRNIYISGVNMKLADKIEVRTDDAESFLKEMEPKMEDMWLRILNSGSNVQS
ncbi:MAG: tape measure protein, partial [Bacteroidota bacterium]